VLLVAVAGVGSRIALSAVNHLPADVWTALKDARSFETRRSVSAIPASVRAAFAKAVGDESFAMAEPGGEWQVTDVTEKPELPRRRLRGVAQSKSLCILFYELGGRAESDHVAVFRLKDGGAELAWQAVLDWKSKTDRVAADPGALLAAIEAGRVYGGPTIYH